MKGFHYSTFIPKIYKSKSVFTKTCRVKFDRSCKYTIDEQSCVNKLWGFSNGLFGVHKNSWRFGWTYDKYSDSIILWYYIYDNGILRKKKIKQLQFDVIYTLSIDLVHKDDLWTVSFLVEDEIVHKEYFSNIKSKCLWLELGWYFGGKTKCPHKMCLYFNRVNLLE